MSSQEGQGLRGLMGLCFRELEIDMSLQLIQVLIPLVQILAITIDGKALKDDEMIIAFGVTAEGKKVTLGFVQTGAENAIVSKDFLNNLFNRGLNRETGMPYIMDGSN